MFSISSGKLDCLLCRVEVIWDDDKRMGRFYVYIMTNQNHTVLYTGVSNSIVRRMPEHKEKRNKRSFTARYNINKLVYYEVHRSIKTAIRREKYIKSKGRAYKISLIMKMNPFWVDLFKEYEYEMDGD